jgi:hypothetical protein
MSAPLIISQTVVADLKRLREAVAKKPIDMLRLSCRLATRAGKLAHRDQMRSQTVVIPGPYPFNVSLSIETGHPGGSARHMTMSIARPGRVPSPAAAWTPAQPAS